MAQDRTAEQVAGVVTCANDRGFKLDGSEAWLNISKFASVAVPPKGSRVQVGLDKSGYVREVELISCAVQEIVEPSLRSESEQSAAPPSKDTQIARMNALGHAVTIAATNGSADVEDVLSIAEMLERWILR